MNAPNEIFRVSICIPGEIAMISTKDHLSRMGFAVEVTPPRDKHDKWLATAQIELNETNKTRKRVRNVLETLIGAMDATFKEE